MNCNIRLLKLNFFITKALKNFAKTSLFVYFTGYFSTFYDICAYYLSLKMTSRLKGGDNDKTLIRKRFCTYDRYTAKLLLKKRILTSSIDLNQN